MAGKNINVKLTFQADASAAKREMASLQQNLSNLAATNTTKLISPKAKQDLTDAKNKAIELKIALNNATNVKTGKLNFTKFSQELKQSKMTVQDFGAALAKLGPEGSEAMLQLSRAIRTAETPIVSLKGKVAALADTLTNTIRWQISSSITQGAVSAFSSVIDYAKELNESLNNIRIVTNKSEIEMSKFAKSANKAAKALSTTTKEYTDASLIYFQ